MTNIHERCRANMAKADRALRTALDEIERLRSAYDSRGGEMDSMRMVLAETQKWNEDRLADNERLRAALLAIANRERPSTARSMARRALEPKP